MAVPFPHRASPAIVGAHHTQSGPQGQTESRKFANYCEQILEYLQISKSTPALHPMQMDIFTRYP
ncbi:hypothetical protein C6W92_07590 [Roseovarius sp. A46]|nr:hypothetical protein C6W92_07590 [Roseovarius sp. A46]